MGNNPLIEIDSPFKSLKILTGAEVLVSGPIKFTLSEIKRLFLLQFSKAD